MGKYHRLVLYNKLYLYHKVSKMVKSNKSLGEELKRVSEMVQRVEENDGSMNAIERSIFLDALQQMYEIVLHLPAPERKDVVAPQQHVAEEVSPKENEPRFAVVAEEEQPTFSHPTMEEVEGSRNDELFEDVESDAAARGAAEEERARAAASQQAAANEEKEGCAEPSLFDLLNKSRAAESEAPEAPTPKTLGEKFTQSSFRMEDDAESNIRQHKVSDLRTIININDKFSFMSELFHNNMKAYNDFILRLNATSDREQALSYMGEMAQQYHWDNESLAVKTFFTIFDKKF